MKICITASGPDLNSSVDPRFGRCGHLLFVDSETSKVLKSVANQNAGMPQGAGIAVAQIVAGGGARALITGNIGPNAFMALSSAGIKMYLGAFGLTAAQALEKFQNGELEEVSGPTGPGRMGPGFGMGPGGGRGRGRGRF